MAGKSSQEKAAEQFYNEVGGLKTDVRNRWDNYEDPFGFNKMESKIGDVFSGYEDIINRDTAEEIATQQGNTASAMASRGILGGSVLSDTQSDVANKLNKGKMNALSQLGIGKSSALSDLMQYFNQLGFAKTKAATDVDFGNIGNLFKKYGLKGSAIGGLDDTTAWDDIYAGLNTAGNTASGAASLITALSDRRFKHNIEKVDVVNGINIYEFSYIGDNKRFRGVMADEVPEATISIGGILFVDYAKLPNDVLFTSI